MSQPNLFGYYEGFGFGDKDLEIGIWGLRIWVQDLLLEINRDWDLKIGNCDGRLGIGMGIWDCKFETGIAIEMDWVGIF